MIPTIPRTNPSILRTLVWLNKFATTIRVENKRGRGRPNKSQVNIIRSDSKNLNVMSNVPHKEFNE